MRTLAERDALVLDHLPLVKSIQRRYYSFPKHPDREEDLRQEGYVALIQSAARWSPQLGAPFRLFASYRVHGAMADHCRRADGYTRNPATRYTMLSLSASTYHPPFEDPVLAVAPLAIDLGRAMATLKPRDQALIDRIIVRDQEQTEIARDEHLSSGRISQRLTAVRGKLRTALC